MATRRISKAQSRQKQAPEPAGAVVAVSFNGESTTGNCTAKNGTSPGFEQIQRRAYELYMARGGIHGCDWADWFIAEQELTAISGADH
jgi:hypothetical protein